MLLSMDSLGALRILMDNLTRKWVFTDECAPRVQISNPVASDAVSSDTASPAGSGN
jgi:hypothetical protein